jgi:hypothetical protein
MKLGSGFRREHSAGRGAKTLDRTALSRRELKRIPIATGVKVSLAADVQRDTTASDVEGRDGLSADALLLETCCSSEFSVNVAAAGFDLMLIDDQGEVKNHAN